MQIRDKLYLVRKAVSYTTYYDVKEVEVIAVEANFEHTYSTNKATQMSDSVKVTFRTDPWSTDRLTASYYPKTKSFSGWDLFHTKEEALRCCSTKNWKVIDDHRKEIDKIEKIIRQQTEEDGKSKDSITDSTD